MNFDFLNRGAMLAPMAGVTDMPFRVLCHEMGCPMAVSEMVSAKGYLLAPKDNRATRELLSVDERERGAVALQLFGHEPEIMARAAEIVAAVAKASHVPVTVKMRLGFEAGSETYLLLGQLAQESGAQMITLHARTRSQFYEGRADWSAIGKLKRRVSIPVVGNGDVTCWQDALRMREETGCDGVAVGRAAQGNPWIFRQIADAMAGKAAVEPTNEEKFDVLRRHLHALAQLKGEAVAVREMRRHIVCYVRGMRDAARLRVRVNAITDIGEMESALRAFMLEGRV